MDQTERLDNAKRVSIVSALFALVGFFLSLSIWMIMLSAWPAWWLYLITIALAVGSFVAGYKARRDLIDLGVYQHSNFYQGTAVISLGCSPTALLLLLVLALFVASTY